MYKLVFGITNLKGLEQNDFKFIPAASVKPIKAQDDAADVDDTAAAADDQTRLRWAGRKASTVHEVRTPGRTVGVAAGPLDIVWAGVGIRNTGQAGRHA